MIWKYNNGNVPSGYHVDHIENVACDEIDNLQVLEISEHRLKTGEEFSGKNNACHKVYDTDAYSKNKSSSSTLSANGRYLGLTNLDIFQYYSCIVIFIEGIGIRIVKVPEKFSS